MSTRCHSVLVLTDKLSVPLDIGLHSTSITFEWTRKMLTWSSITWQHMIHLLNAPLVCYLESLCFFNKNQETMISALLALQRLKNAFLPFCVAACSRKKIKTFIVWPQHFIIPQIGHVVMLQINSNII